MHCCTWHSDELLLSSARRMTSLRAVFIFTLSLLALPVALSAQQLIPWSITPLPGGSDVEYDVATGTATATNGVMVVYGEVILTARQIVGNSETGLVVADGKVRIQEGDQLWASEHISYNFKTRQIEAEQFRTGEPPMFAQGRMLRNVTNGVYLANDAMVTSDDIEQPLIKIRAKSIKLIPGKKIEARQATLYVGNVPVFYFPYYSRNLTEHAGHFIFLPGYRTAYGPFLMTTYTWWMSDYLDGAFHLDYREKRGPGVGPDLYYNLGRQWGNGTLRYYYTYDKDTAADDLGTPIPENRQRVWFSYEANPATNLYVKSLVLVHQSDFAVVRDFFEQEYRQDPQPDSFLEVNKFWQNFSVDAYVQPQVNQFLETVERLPDIRLTGFRQQIGSTPLYYESESSAGYYEFAFAQDAGTNGPPPGLNYEAARADTYHQVVLPQTFFGWLNVTPRVGGRFTCFTAKRLDRAPQRVEQNRWVFNITGAEVSLF